MPGAPLPPKSNWEAKFWALYERHDAAAENAARKDETIQLLTTELAKAHESLKLERARVYTATADAAAAKAAAAAATSAAAAVKPANLPVSLSEQQAMEAGNMSF